MWHASDFAHIYAGLGFIFSLVIHVKDRRSHFDEWQHSSIDFDENSETPSFRLKKCLNKVLSMTLHTCILMTFWPAFLSTSIISHVRR